jgi:hypothetical protein
VRQDLKVRGLGEFKTIGAAGWVRAKVKGGGKGLERKLAELQQNGFDVEPDYVVRALATPNDPAWSSISGAMNKIGAPAAWDLHTGTAAVTVCVIDTGARAHHAPAAARCCLWDGTRPGSALAPSALLTRAPALLALHCPPPPVPGAPPPYSPAAHPRPWAAHLRPRAHSHAHARPILEQSPRRHPARPPRPGGQHAPRPGGEHHQQPHDDWHVSL